jgi:hypothetical protein
VCRTSKPPVTTPAPKITIVARMTFQVFTRWNRKAAVQCPPPRGLCYQFPAIDRLT